VLGRLLREDGADVAFAGREESAEDTVPVELVRDRWILAPVSGIDAQGRIKAPTASGFVVLEPDTASASRGIVAGYVDPAWAARLAVPVVTYRERDPFAWANAVPTAEGAIAWALEARPDVLQGLVATVVGFGRVAQILVPRLAGIGLTVRVAVRDRAAQAHAAALGYRGGPIDQDAFSHAALVFNTVPVPILTAALLERLPSDARVLDMASPPGGLTAEARRLLGERLEWQPSLPGRIAPVTAAAVVHAALRDIVPILLHAHASGSAAARNRLDQSE
jgi:dipicolinate synthase subunit A